MGNVYLTGMMGCGKTAIGRETARRAKRKFIDIDKRIEEQEKKTISEIFAQQGEAVFRELETQALREIAQKEKDAVVSCGGGIILSDENIAIMRGSGSIVYIERPLEEIERTASLKNRPVLQSDPGNIRRVFEQRKERYESASDFRVRNDGAIWQAARQLIRKLEL